MYREDLKRKQEDMGQLHEEYVAFRDGLPDDERKWTPEQNEKFDRFDKDIEKLDREISQLRRKVKDEEREARYSQPEGDFMPDLGFLGGQGQGGHRSGGQSPYGTQRNYYANDCDYRSNPNGRSPEHIWHRYIQHGTNGISAEEYRSMQAGDDVGGGFLVVPQKFVNGLLAQVDDSVFLRKFGTIHGLKKSGSLGIVTLDDDLDDAEWTTELKTGSEDNLEFGKRELRTHPIAKRVKVSNTLLRKSHLNPGTLVCGRLGKKFAETEEKAYMTGDGRNKPLGLFVASDDGIPTSRDVSADNTSTALKSDNLIEVQGTLKEAYQKNAMWLFHRKAITCLRKLKDGDGQYIWQPGLVGGEANKILGKPYVVSEYCPKTFTAGQYVGMYGDFSYYWIAVALDMQIQRLNELYAETDQTGFIGRAEVDGQPVMAEAFVRVQMAT